MELAAGYRAIGEPSEEAKAAIEYVKAVEHRYWPWWKRWANRAEWERREVSACFLEQKRRTEYIRAIYAAKTPVVSVGPYSTASDNTDTVAIGVADAGQFAPLNDLDRELLTMLAEEAAEVIHAVSKVLRHGLNSRHPEGGSTNAEVLAAELIDMNTVRIMLQDHASTDTLMWAVADDVAHAFNDRIERKRRYMHNL